MSTSISSTDICPVCHATEFVPHLLCKDSLYSGEYFHVAKCSQCGMLITQSAPLPEEIGRYYKSEEYISHSDTKTSPLDRIYHAVRRYMLGRKRQWIVGELGANPATLLDIGTGTGYFPAHMARYGTQVWAVEQDEDARTCAETKHHIRPWASLSEATLANHSLEVITLWHVLEHLPHLDEHLQKISDKLSENGLLVIALPNPLSWDATFYQKEWAGYDVPRHLWHFSSDSIQQLLDRHGFRLVKTRPMPLDGVYISLLSEKNSGARCAVLRGLITGLRAWVMTLFRSSRSSSMVYFFRRK